MHHIGSVVGVTAYATKMVTIWFQFQTSLVRLDFFQFLFRFSDMVISYDFINWIMFVDIMCGAVIWDLLFYIYIYVICAFVVFAAEKTFHIILDCSNRGQCCITFLLWTSMHSFTWKVVFVVLRWRYCCVLIWWTIFYGTWNAFLSIKFYWNVDSIIRTDIDCIPCLLRFIVFSFLSFAELYFNCLFRWKFYLWNHLGTMLG